MTFHKCLRTVHKTVQKKGIVILFFHSLGSTNSFIPSENDLYRNPTWYLLFLQHNKSQNHLGVVYIVSALISKPDLVLIISSTQQIPEHWSGIYSISTYIETRPGTYHFFNTTNPRTIGVVYIISTYFETRTGIYHFFNRTNTRTVGINEK